MSMQPEQEAPAPLTVWPAPAGEPQGATLDAPPPTQPTDDSSNRATRLRESEEEIGRLVMRVRELTDAAVAEANDEARKVVAQAETQAAGIVEAATVEAARRRAAALPVATIQQIRTTLETFDRVNSELGHQLRTLWDVLDAEIQAQPQVLAPSNPDPVPPADNGQGVQTDGGSSPLSP